MRGDVTTNASTHSPGLQNKLRGLELLDVAVAFLLFTGQQFDVSTAEQTRHIIYMYTRTPLLT